MVSEDPRIPVIYVAGAGRSGSTLLDTILGTHPMVEGVGELTRLVRLGWMENHYCSCGRRGNDCPFWARVRQRFEAGEEPGFLQKSIQWKNGVERHRGILPIGRHKNPGDPFFDAWAGQTRTLVETILFVGAKRSLVDSSKNPVRLRALLEIQELKTYGIHIVRNPLGVAFSLARAWQRSESEGIERDFPAKPVWRSGAFWVWANLATEWVLRKMPRDRWIRLRYEDLVMRPRESLDRISRLTGIDFSEQGRAAEAGEAFDTGHTIAGNRLRMQGKVRVEPGKGMKWRLSFWNRLVVRLLTWPLMLRYGYR